VVEGAKAVQAWAGDAAIQSLIKACEAVVTKGLQAKKSQHKNIKRVHGDVGGISLSSDAKRAVAEADTAPTDDLAFANAALLNAATGLAAPSIRRLVNPRVVGSIV